MNVMEATALAVFQQLGWRKRREKTGDAVAFRRNGDDELRAILQIRQLPGEQKMTLLASTGLKDYSNIVGVIFGAKPSHESLHQKELVRRTAEISEKEIEEVSKEAVTWWQEQDNLAAIEALTAPPPDTGQLQLMHLAALAYLGDFNTLMDYQEIFRRGKRLNFVPMIKPEMIDRAVDIALERA